MTNGAASNTAGPIVLGAGFTGLAAAHGSDRPVYEASDAPGGICASYYMRPGTGARLRTRPSDGGAYRFEIGGGHWIFGGDPALVEFLQGFAPVRHYQRRSGVFFAGLRTYVDYPLQDHLEQLDRDDARSAHAELAAMSVPASGDGVTQKEWLTARFGPTLCELFFHPFNDRYTAGLYERIAPQDAYKSPPRARASTNGSTGGYNATFIYPTAGLDALARALAQNCRVAYGKRAVDIDARAQTVSFEDGTVARYDRMISTLPLLRILCLAGVDLGTDPDPYTSALVLNIGATRGKALPDYHWVYVPDSRSNFHRVGIYSNVDRDFLPQEEEVARVGLYVERAFRAGELPDARRLAEYTSAVIDELREWGFIDEVEVVDPSWIDVAYTWTLPGSTWRARALESLAARGIYSAGRYGRWVYQGIADSIRDGLSLATALVNA